MKPSRSSQKRTYFPGISTYREIIPSDALKCSEKSQNNGFFSLSIVFRPRFIHAKVHIEGEFSTQFSTACAKLTEKSETVCKLSAYHKFVSGIRMQTAVCRCFVRLGSNISEIYRKNMINIMGKKCR